MFVQNFINSKVVCDVAQGEVIRNGTQWIGVYIHENKSFPAIASVCPLNYCTNVTQVSLAHPEALCSKNRTGALCGCCSDGYSVGLWFIRVPGMLKYVAHYHSHVRHTWGLTSGLCCLF